jgi:membrane fusion protein, copper/silver efflux system
MPRAGLAVLLLIVTVAVYGLAFLRPQLGGNPGLRPLYYVDPMHPSYKSDKPGTAPDCGMPLVPVYAGDPADGARTLVSRNAVTIDGATRRRIGIRVAPVTRSAVTHIIRTIGRVAAEDTRVYRINAGVEGIVRQTYSDSIGAPVKKEEKLAAFYAPDFLAASSGFLAANERVPGSGGGDGARTMPFPGALSKQGQGSIQAYTDRLRNLGMSDAQIRRMAETRQLQETIDIVSPVDGVIVARNISPGQHFEHNTEFYRIADLTRVWVMAELSQRELPYSRPGALARITIPGSEREYAARVTDTLPQQDASGATAKLRLEVENRTLLLRPEMLVDVKLPIRLLSAVTAPLDALVDSGARSRVYVETVEGAYEAREVETGWRTDDQVEIRSGLRPGERVVVGATFLVDSESRMQAATPRSAPGQLAATVVKDPNCGMKVDPTSATAGGTTFTQDGTSYYFCSKKCLLEFESRRKSGRHHGDDDD